MNYVNALLALAAKVGSVSTEALAQFPRIESNIGTFVVAAETTGLPGADKLDAVLQKLETVINAIAPELMNDIEEIMKLVADVVNGLVALFNEGNALFGHKTVTA